MLFAKNKALNHSDRKVRLAATRELIDQAALEQIAKTDSYFGFASTTNVTSIS
jgi:hypothetical protein